MIIPNPLNSFSFGKPALIDVTSVSPGAALVARGDRSGNNQQIRLQRLDAQSLRCAGGC
jgi:hypothetical protein